MTLEDSALAWFLALILVVFLKYVICDKSKRIIPSKHNRNMTNGLILQETDSKSYALWIQNSENALCIWRYYIFKYNVHPSILIFHVSHYICTVHCYPSPGQASYGTVHSPLFIYSTLLSYPSPGQARYGTLTSIYVQYLFRYPFPGQARYGTLTSIYVQYTVKLSLPLASQVRTIH